MGFKHRKKKKKNCLYHFAKCTCFNITKFVVVGVFTCINILLLKDGCLPACTEYWKKGGKNSNWQWRVCGNRKNSSLAGLLSQCAA